MNSEPLQLIRAQKAAIGEMPGLQSCVFSRFKRNALTVLIRRCRG